MNQLDNLKPCVVETPQGFSVSYKGHFLYSKYSPSKAIVTAVNQLQILPGSIILCFSPVLPYGLQELKEKLPENCLLVLCEVEKELYNFSVSNYNKTLFYPAPEELNQLPVTLYNLNSKGTYKRVIKLDFSAGAQLHKQFYDELYTACVNSIMTFWKNRITLSKFGRKYSKNLFSNLSILGYTTPIKNYFNKIERPIIVFGAGQSIDCFLNKHSINIKNFYILCADTALQPLIKRNIIPDGVFIEEAQSVISKAFIGTTKNVHIFAGLSSLPQIANIYPHENISFFMTEYTNASFIKNLESKSFLPPVNPPYGSVGLTAVHYALKFRKDDTIPIYVVGLDFSYSSGLTHAKNTLAHITRLISNNRIHPVQNYEASFNSSAIKFLDKQNKLFYTTPTLQTYAQTFNNVFIGYKNLYDSGECGIPLALIQATPLSYEKVKNISITENKYNKQDLTDIEEYLSNERKSLIKLRKLLTEKTDFSEDELKEEIIKIAESKEYLYLHFADGYTFTYSQSFLNRIRTEIDFFLKFFTHHHFL